VNVSFTSVSIAYGNIGVKPTDIESPLLKRLSELILMGFKPVVGNICVFLKISNLVHRMYSSYLLTDIAHRNIYIYIILLWQISQFRMTRNIPI